MITDSQPQSFLISSSVADLITCIPYLKQYSFKWIMPFFLKKKDTAYCFLR